MRLSQMSVAFGPDGDRAPSAKIRAQRESASGGKTAILIEPAELATALAERRRKDSRCSETALARRAFYLLYRDATKRFRRLVGTVDRASSGHEVRIVTAPPYYPEWRTPKAFRGWRYRREITKGVAITRTPIYVPGNPTGAKRLIHHATFALSSAFPIISNAVRWRPDVVFSVAPSLMSAALSAWIAKTRRSLFVASPARF